MYMYVCIYKLHANSPEYRRPSAFCQQSQSKCIRAARIEPSALQRWYLPMSQIWIPNVGVRALGTLVEKFMV